MYVAPLTFIILYSIWAVQVWFVYWADFWYNFVSLFFVSQVYSRFILDSFFLGFYGSSNFSTLFDSSTK